MFNSKILRHISMVVLVTFTSMTMQPLQAAVQMQNKAGQGGANAFAQRQQANLPPQQEDALSRTLVEMDDLVKQIVPRAGQYVAPAAKAKTASKTKKHKVTRAFGPGMRVVVEESEQPLPGVNVAANLKKLRSKHQQLKALAAQAEQDFAATDKHLKEHNLPPEILARQQAAVEQFRSRQREYNRLLSAVERASDKKQGRALVTALNNLARFNAQHPNQQTHTPSDPNNLPFGTPSGKVRAPITTDKGFKTSLFRPDPLASMLAGPVPNGFTLPATTLPTTPTPEDLVATEDIVITPAIQALATNLNNDPVQIYNWVHNNIEYLPTYGSIQGADMTLQTKRGNSFDTASLLIGLLRAANIPARYVYGTIRVPADQAMNWVGGVTKPEAAQQLMGQGGIPNIGMMQGGVIKYIMLEHVWVEAYVDYIPSRGAVNKTGDSWVPMDASYKQYTYTQGMDIKSAVPLDAQALIDQAQTGATIDPSGWVQNINGTAIQTALTSYQTQVQDYINTTKPNATVGDVIDTKTIVPQNDSILMGTLPYTTIAIGAKLQSLPANLRHSINLNLYTDAMSRALENPTLSYSQSLPSLAGKKVALVYEPATPADQAVITAAANSDQITLPAYLIRLVPVLKVEGVAVATGSSATMGDTHILSVGVAAPWYNHDRDYRITAGDLSIVGIDAAGVTPSLFNARTTQHDLSKGTDPDFTAEMFYQVILGWWGEKYAYNDIMGNTNHIVSYQLPSHGLAAAPVTVNYFFGIPRTATYKRRVLDVKEDFVMAMHVNDDKEIRRRFMMAMGTVGSYLEAGIYDQAFLLTPGYSMSSVTALKAANDMGVPIYTIDQSNVAAALPQIATDTDTIMEFQNAIAAGKRVTTAQRDITVGNFTGMGYIIEDTVTGSAAYMISGGRNGGDAPAPQSYFPLPQIPYTMAMAWVLGAIAKQADAKILVSTSGLIIGVTAPPTNAPPAPRPMGPGIGIGIGIIIVLFMLLTSQQAELDKSYPEEPPIRLRKYSSRNRALNNLWGGKIFASAGPSGFGVFLAAQDEPKLDRIPIVYGVPMSLPVTCSNMAANAKGLATAYEIPSPDSPPDPTKATGYVDIEITRPTYYFGSTTPYKNSHGVDEYLIISPLTPADSAGNRFLVVGTPLTGSAFGIRITDWCF